MRKVFLILLLTTLLTACREKLPVESSRTFTDIVRLKTTPVKQQGQSENCWIYAMLATIETEHLAAGDSVNLSADYASRMYLYEQTLRHYLSACSMPLNMRGMAPMLIRLIGQYGIEPYSTYGPQEPANYNIVSRKVAQLAKTCHSFEQLNDNYNRLMDQEIGFLPRFVFMAGAEYTPLEFAHSVCRHHEYTALTSYTHYPFYETFALEVPDNKDDCTFVNLPIDSLMTTIDKALLGGHPVCWEGDISNTYFSFEKGTADLFLPHADMQRLRQQAFESLIATDDHCLCLVGIAEDEQQRRYYIAKNSWGTENAFDGFVYLSADYVRLYTLCVVLSSETL